MSTASRLLAAVAGPGAELTQGLLALQSERDKTRSATALAQQKLTAEMLTSSFEEASKHYNTLLNSDFVNEPTMKPLLDRALSNYLNAQQARNTFFGIRPTPNVTAWDLVNHEMMLLPEDKRSWSASNLEAMKRKHPNQPDAVWKGVEVIWKAKQPKATKADKEAALKFAPDGSIASGDTSLAYGFDYVPEKINLGGPAWLDDALNFLKQSSVKQDVRDVQAHRRWSETSDERALRMGLPVESTATPSPSSAIVDQILSDPQPTGETPQLIPISAVEELRDLDKQFGTGTGGLMSLADTIEESQEQTMSQKVKEFFDEYILYIQEYGQRQADQYMSRFFAELSYPEQQEVKEILA